MEMRKVYIGEMEVDFDSLKSGDKCIIRDPKSFHLVLVKSSMFKNDENIETIMCDLISSQVKSNLHQPY